MSALGLHDDIMMGLGRGGTYLQMRVAGWDILVERGGRVGFRGGSAKRERRMETSLMRILLSSTWLKKKHSTLSACNCATNYPYFFSLKA